MSRPWLFFNIYLKRYLKRRTHLALVLLSVLLLAVDYVTPRLMMPLRVGIEHIVAPLSRTTDMLALGSDFITRVLTQAGELEHLREENHNLRQWWQYAQALVIENRQLNAYFGNNHYRDKTQIQHFQLRSGSHFQAEELLRIDLAEKYTLPDQAAVINEYGLVGRVVGQKARHANVMLLSHPDSRIPVQIGGKAIRAMLAGQGYRRATLDYYHNAPYDGIELGDVVVTSGFLGQLPVGVHIGTISDIDEDGIEVMLNFEPGRLRYVGVILDKAEASSPIAQSLAVVEEAS